MTSRLRALNCAAAIAPLTLIATVAHAAIAISSQPTQNMTCTNGVCAPTAKSAVLNTGDLETLLASGNVTVTTTGSGVEAGNIAVKSALSWSTASSLSLSAHRSIDFDAPVSVVGQSGLTIQTNGAKGTFTFGSKGSVGFSNLSSALTINGVAYTLAGNVKTLAADISANPSGAYALAATYDASADGTYNSSPIGTILTGTFEGLGNTIMNLSVNGATDINGAAWEGLFAEIGVQGTAENVGLANATISGDRNRNSQLFVGSLAGDNFGWIGSAHASGTILVTRVGPFTQTGGLVGENAGTIEHSSAAASVNSWRNIGGLVGFNSGTIDESSASGEVAGINAPIGGLVGNNGGTISNSFATGDVVANGAGPSAGGLVGIHQLGSIVNSYATGSVKWSQGLNSAANLGGLVGASGHAIRDSYSTGAVTGATGDNIGGLLGLDGSSGGSLTDTDWDTTTSGITNLSQGAGNIANDPGITGLSTAQFQSGLPPGFDPKIWAEKPNINGGLPYLLANPPAK